MPRFGFDAAGEAIEHEGEKVSRDNIVWEVGRC